MVQNHGSNLNPAEPDRGPVQGSGPWKNWTNGPVRGSEPLGYGRTGSKQVRTLNRPNEAPISHSQNCNRFSTPRCQHSTLLIAIIIPRFSSPCFASRLSYGRRFIKGVASNYGKYSFPAVHRSSVTTTTRTTPEIPITLSMLLARCKSLNTVALNCSKST